MFLLVLNQPIEYSVIISSSFSKISYKFSPEQVDASNPLTESSFSYTGPVFDLISAYSTEATPSPPFSLFIFHLHKFLVFF